MLGFSILLRGGSSLVGIGSGRAAGEVLATVQGDGVTAFDAATQVK